MIAARIPSLMLYDVPRLMICLPPAMTASAATAPFLPITSSVDTAANLLVITVATQKRGKARNVQDAHGCD